MDWRILSSRRCGALLAIAAILAVLVFAGPALAQPGDTFAISGHVVNGTAGAGIPTNVQIQAYGYTAGRVDGPWTASIDENGAYRVEDVARVDGAIYVLGIDYSGASYAERLEQPGTTPLVTKDLTVYESSQVDPGIQFEQAAILVSNVDGGQGVMSVLEIHRLDNPTDRTFAPSAAGPGGPAGLLVFPLPAEAYDLRAEVGLDPARLVQIDRGFASLAPVPPGRTEIGFSYKFPYTDTSFQLNRTVRYPISRFNVLVPQDGPAVESDRLAPSDVASFGGKSYRTLTGGPLAVGQPLQISFSGLPLPGGPLGRVPAGAAAIAGVVIGLVVLVTTALRPRPEIEPTTASEEVLVDRLVAIEVEHAEAGLSDAEYHRARGDLLAQLKLGARPES
jgi:hypothetical protein